MICQKHWLVYKCDRFKSVEPPIFLPVVQVKSAHCTYWRKSGLPRKCTNSMEGNDSHRVSPSTQVFKSENALELRILQSRYSIRKKLYAHRPRSVKVLGVSISKTMDIWDVWIAFTVTFDPYKAQSARIRLLFQCQSLAHFKRRQGW